MPVAYTCAADAGATLTFEFRAWPDLSQPGSIDISHKGPCAMYVKQVQTMATDSGAGAGWIKLWDEGYDETAGKWCTEKLMDTNGLLSFVIPAGLPSGYWLFRPELVGLQNVGAPQFFTGCAQVFVQGNNTAALNVPAAQQVSIPGYLKGTEQGLQFNIYSPQFPYAIPGPAVFDVPPPSGSGIRKTTATQMQGVIPSNYIVKNGNWVGMEVSSYADEDGCWEASAQCYAQTQDCYNSAPPTGDEGCRAFETKCDGIQAACNNSDFVGPPNKGQRLSVTEPGLPGPIPGPVNS
ncbi:lytic polysaccharide monooxygenase [Xylariaceae sp. FL0255]|nr:lytic polysaccharide monooxygenase [Xylariaceae sp. FL0255]